MYLLVPIIVVVGVFVLAWRVLGKEEESFTEQRKREKAEKKQRKKKN